MRLSCRLSIFLVLSIALNLFLAGVLVSQWFGATSMKKFGPFNHQAAAEALNEEDRETVDRIWTQSRGKIRDRLFKARELRAQIRTELTADVVDKPALEGSFDDLRDTMTSIADDIFATIVQIAETLPLSERRQYFEAGLSQGRPFPPDPFDKDAPGAPAAGDR